jgi:hypothetical protein
MILSLVLTFYGRYILRLLRIDQGQKPQIMLQLMAGIAVMVFIGQVLLLYITNLTVKL